MRRHVMGATAAFLGIALVGAGCSAGVSTTSPGASSVPSTPNPSTAAASSPSPTAGSPSPSVGPSPSPVASPSPAPTTGASPSEPPPAPSLAASPSPGGSPPASRSTGPATTPAPSAVPAADLTVLGQTPVKLPNEMIVGPSPDGTELAAYDPNGKRLCVYRLPSLEEVSCSPQSGGGTPLPRNVDLRSVAWSPDSTRIAFTENLFVYAFESDIWTMDIASGGLTDLTDDGVSGPALPVPPNAQFDVVPAWMPDGAAIVFARTPASTHATEIDRIDATAGAQPTPIAHVSTEPEVVFYGTRVSADGSQIAITLDPRTAQDPSGGIYLIGADGLTSRHVLGPDPVKKVPYLVGINTTFSLALVDYEQAAAAFSNSGETYYTLNVAEGSLDPVRPAALRGSSDLPVISAVLSPDGTKVAYTFRSGSSYKLAVRDISGGPEHVLVEQPADQVLGNGARGIGLAWPTDTELFAPTTGGSTGIVFTLGVSTH